MEELTAPITASVSMPFGGKEAQAAGPQFSAEGLVELSGTRLGNFEVGPVLGSGRCGMVFRARDRRDDRVIALKVLHPGFPKNDAELQRFHAGMKTILPLRHAHLVTFYSAGKTGPYCWIAMEYVEGESLAQVIQRAGKAGPPPWQLAFRLAVHVARGLHYAGRYQLIHRDITPQNILFRSTDNLIKLGDLILARALGGSQVREITRRAKIDSDVVHRSPEQTQSNTNVDGRSDIFSLGTAVYALLTGWPPFVGKSALETIQMIRETDPVKPRQLHPAIPEPLEAIVLTMLAKRPEDRFQDAGELLNDLARITPDPA